MKKDSYICSPAEAGKTNATKVAKFIEKFEIDSAN